MLSECRQLSHITNFRHGFESNLSTKITCLRSYINLYSNSGGEIHNYATQIIFQIWIVSEYQSHKKQNNVLVKS